ncbi:hypothetical protein CFP56_029910 [Quercus suber]|uniref:Uncharacterized protein n=1 Tax=Quercus suber TaxID=58331 RepID=A0AAW0JRN5_QUESU
MAKHLLPLLNHILVEKVIPPSKTNARTLLPKKATKFCLSQGTSKWKLTRRTRERAQPQEYQREDDAITWGEDSITWGLGLKTQASFLAASSEDCGVPTTSSSGALGDAIKEKKPMIEPLKH